MSSPEPTPLVYAQDEEFLVAVGEPWSLDEIRRIVVAKRDGLYAEAVRSACAQAFPDAAVEVCRRGDATLETLRARGADFALLGLTFDDLDGVDVLHAINREQLARRVIVVSGRKDDRTLQVLRGARFDGLFDPVEEEPGRFVAALAQVAGGRGFLSASLCRHMVQRRHAGALALQLTPAELQVLSVIGDGSDDVEAAAMLGLSDATVQTHRRNIMRKLGLATSAKLVREAVRLGMVRIGADGGVLRPGFEQLSLERKRAVRPSEAG